MELVKAQRLAVTLMAEYRLEGWRFQFGLNNQYYGVCKHGSKMIELSMALTILNDESQVEDTVRHEIAHALLGSGFGHGHAWKVVANLVGAKSERVCSDGIVTKGRIKAVCPCGKEYHRSRMPRKNKRYYCGECFKRQGMRVFLEWRKE